MVSSSLEEKGSTVIHQVDWNTTSVFQSSVTCYLLLHVPFNKNSLFIEIPNENLNKNIVLIILQSWVSF